MGMLLITECLSVKFVVECNPWWETGHDEAVPGVHVLVWVDLLQEKEIELIVRRAGELSTKKPELVHPARPEIFADVLERRTQELEAILEGEVLAEGEAQLLLHSLTDDSDVVIVVDVLEL